MLVLTRGKGESVCIDGERIIVTLIEITNGKVRLGFEADKSVTINRKEVYDRMKAEVEQVQQKAG